MSRPAWYGGNKIPASYSKMIDERYYVRTGKRPDPQVEELPDDLKCFVHRL